LDQLKHAAGVVAAIVAVVSLVAAAATGGGLLLPGADLSDAAAWALRLLSLGVAAGALVLLVQSRRGRLGPTAAGVVVTAAAVVAGVLLLAYLFSNVEFDRGDTTESERFAGTSTTTTTELTTTTTEPAEPGDSAVDETLGILFFTLLALGVGALVIGALQLLRRSSGQSEPTLEPSIDVALATTGLEATLGAMRDDPHPTAAIDRAYAVLLAALADAGGGRQPQEAPHEHLHRVLGPLGIRPAPTHRLADLFVLTRFSPHSITEVHRQEAVRLLEEALTDLRARASVMEESPL
jgi:hypothetical protein